METISLSVQSFLYSSPVCHQTDTQTTLHVTAIATGCIYTKHVNDMAEQQRRSVDSNIQIQNQATELIQALAKSSLHVVLAAIGACISVNIERSIMVIVRLY